MAIIKSIIFHILLSLRGFVVTVSKLLSLFCITGAVILIFLWVFMRFH